ncbi:spore cortex formation protein SpoVR/YcgB (stage V sporulation) [Nonomuraea jabiensis]|uniref:Spore cortex formation protein SpoVR/YcgB (Stage V sporulation) n=1 Tax=Nonomuraea jabiensis TaxID=882448 RepID=A0A7W9L7H7_9ACTN|nr:spore cortex formation protein SpoVR/YcgB (stage V sporulation) [Nonomuraea jabiensis]
MGTPVNAAPPEDGEACCTAYRHWSYGERYWAFTTNAHHALYGPWELPS